MTRAFCVSHFNANEHEIIRLCAENVILRSYAREGVDQYGGSHVHPEPAGGEERQLHATAGRHRLDRHADR